MRTSLVLGLLLLAVPVLAASKGGVTLPDTVDVGGKTLVLNGIALRSKTLIITINVYVAGLYLPAKENSAEKILAADEPRRMVMHFLTSRATKGKIVETWEAGLKANTPNASDEVKKNWATLIGWMEGMGPGKTMVFTYVPGEGTKVEISGKVKGTLAGKATADAILNTWLGPKPDAGQRFKRDVLGLK